MVQTYRNYSLRECDLTLAQHMDAIKAGRMTFWQQFTCDKCWKRITVDEPNKLFVSGHCQHCDHVTDLQKTGCNYRVAIATRAVQP